MAIWKCELPPALRRPSINRLLITVRWHSGTRGVCRSGSSRTNARSHAGLKRLDVKVMLASLRQARAARARLRVAGVEIPVHDCLEAIGNITQVSRSRYTRSRSRISAFPFDRVVTRHCAWRIADLLSILEFAMDRRRRVPAVVHTAAPDWSWASTVPPRLRVAESGRPLDLSAADARQLEVARTGAVWLKKGPPPKSHSADGERDLSWRREVSGSGADRQAFGA
jgi:hypothetical protein